MLKNGSRTDFLPQRADLTVGRGFDGIRCPDMETDHVKSGLFADGWSVRHSKWTYSRKEENKAELTATCVAPSEHRHGNCSCRLSDVLNVSVDLPPRGAWHPLVSLAADPNAPKPSSFPMRSCGRRNAPSRHFGDVRCTPVQRNPF